MYNKAGKTKNIIIIFFSAFFFFFLIPEFFVVRNEHMEIPQLILIVLFYELVMCLIFGFGLIEICCFFTRQNGLKKPYITSILTSLLIGLLIIALMMITASGEGGMILMVILPYMPIGFIIGGTIIGFTYKKIDRTIIHKRGRHVVYIPLK